MHKLKVLISSRSRDEADQVGALLADFPNCDSEIRIGSNGHVDPLHGISTAPDLLLLCDIDADEELNTLSRMPQNERPALVVFGPGQDTESVKRAMRAGARDYLTLPLQQRELFDILGKITAERETRNDSESGSLHVFINGKGGSGASFLAVNIAHGLASSEHKVTLVDLDLQFAGLCRYLDITPTRDLIDAVHAVEELDEVSAMAFTNEHDSGLRLLSCRAENLHLNTDVSPERLVAALQIYKTFNDFVIVDLPRHIDLVSASVLESADRISIVTQQSYPHLHDTARLLHILQRELTIDKSRVTIVVNRYEKKSPIEIADIENALRIDNIIKIPNHYRSTSESVNSGVPLIEVKAKSNVTKGLQDYYQSLVSTPKDTGPRSRLQSLFRRS